MEPNNFQLCFVRLSCYFSLLPLSPLIVSGRDPVTLLRDAISGSVTSCLGAKRADFPVEDVRPVKIRAGTYAQINAVIRVFFF